MGALEKAQSLIQQGDLKKARDVYRRALAKARSEDDEILTAIILCHLGPVYNELGQPSQALKVLQEALALLREDDDLPNEGKAAVLHNLGAVYLALGQKDQALEHYEQALAIYPQIEVKDRWNESLTLEAIGNIYLDMRRLQDALAAYLQYEKILGQGADADEQLKALDIISNLYGHLGQDEKEFEYMRRAVPVARRAKNHFTEGLILLNLGIYCHNHMQLQEAVEYCDKALATARRFGNSALEGSALNSLGDAYLELGLTEQALDYYEQALQVLQQAGGARHMESRIHGSIAALYDDPEDWEKSLEHLQQSLTLAREARDRELERDALFRLAHLYEQVDNIREALLRCQQALAIDKEIDRRPQLGEDLCYMGDLLRRVGEQEIAINQYRGALTYAREAKNGGGERNALWGLGNTCWDRGRVDDAAQYYEQAIEIYEDARQAILSPELRTARFSLGHGLYLNYIRLSVEEGQLARAFHFAERRKARAFLDLLTEAQGDVRAGIDPDLYEQNQRLSGELLDLHRQLSRQLAMPKEKQDDQLIAALESQQQEADRAYQINQAEIRRRNSRYDTITQPEVWDLKRVQEELLDENTALLEYVLAEPQSLLFLVLKSEIKVFFLPHKDEIERQVEELRNAVINEAESKPPEFERYDPRRYPHALELYEALIKPAEQYITGKQLLIVPDGNLHYLSFAMMLTEPVDGVSSPTARPRRQATQRERDGETAGTDTNGQSGNPLTYGRLPYLVRRHAIAYAPSASVAGLLKRETQKRPPVWSRKLVAFAFFKSPLAKKGDERSLPLMLEAALTRLPSQAGLDPLPGSRKEIVEITRLLDEEAANTLDKDAEVDRIDSPAVTVRLGAEATKGAVLTLFDPQSGPQPVRFVHFATHGILYKDKPQFSGLVFNPGRDGDLFWRTFEIFNALIRSEMVVLSACETGLGRTISGEGLVGLSRAFFYAGAASVCASLWMVSDAATARLMAGFYRKLLEDEDSQGGASIDKAEALRRAQLDLIDNEGENKRESHPYFWAAFALIGECN
jgi:CHAT domain-containing protein/predicted negative regulator of RcsB-dependent stress response